MTRPITTAPADTARAMHAAYFGKETNMSADSKASKDQIQHNRNEAYQGGWDDGYAEGFAKGRTDLCITEAECQRRIDAAVQAERDAWEHATFRGDDMAEFATIRSSEADFASLCGQK